jgi:hypothetical protein
MAKDKLALSYIKKNDLDATPDHHGKYYKSDVEELIRSSIDTTYLLDDAIMQQYLGVYT